MRNSDLALEKYWVIQGGYFILVNTVSLVMGITYGRLLFRCGISDQIRYKKISMIE